MSRLRADRCGATPSGSGSRCAIIGRIGLMWRAALVVSVVLGCGATAFSQDRLSQRRQGVPRTARLFNGLEDDHLPFARVGVPVADIIDLNYGYNNSYHHTTEDTLDKLSPKSLQIVGDVILETMRLLNGGAHGSPSPAK